MNESFYTITARDMETTLLDDVWDNIARARSVSVDDLKHVNGILVDGGRSVLPKPREGMTLVLPTTFVIAAAPNAMVTVCIGPRPFLMPLGKKFSIFVRSYAPFDVFGFGFDGDGRGPSTLVNATARAAAVVTVDTGTNHVSDAVGYSSGSHYNCPEGPGLRARSCRYVAPDAVSHVHVGSSARFGDLPTPGGLVTALRLAIKLEATNPITEQAFDRATFGRFPSGRISPDIDLLTTVTLYLAGPSVLVVDTSMEGDGFPNAEAFIRFGDDPAGDMLHHFETTGGQNWGPLTRLPGDGSCDMGATTTTLKLPR